MNLSNDEIYHLIDKELRNKFPERKIKIKLKHGKSYDIFNIEIENLNYQETMNAYKISHKWQVEETNADINYWKVNYLVSVLPIN